MNSCDNKPSLAAWRALWILFVLTWGCLFAKEREGNAAQTTKLPEKGATLSPDFEPLTRPNILYIFADDIGYECLNCYGGLDFETPNLNRMASEGIRFSQAHTTPVCTPSRVSMHTGLYVPRHGHTSVLPVHRGSDKKVDFQAMPTYGQFLQGNGYQTCTTGKWQLATLEIWPDHIRSCGFDSWCVWQIWRNNAKTERHWGPCYNRDGRIMTGLEKRFGPDVLNEYVIEKMTAAAKAKEPFFILHNELLPHWPVIDTPLDRMQGSAPSLHGMILYMDKLAGDLLDTVEKLGIRENTYVFFMGDNGTNQGDVENPKKGQPGEGPHTRHTKAGNVEGGKSHLGDAGSHVPLIVWGPKEIPAGSVNDELIDIVDLFPTFCQLTSTEIPDFVKLDGRSIASQIHGQPGLARDWAHQQLGGKFGGVSVFDGKFRLFKNGKLIDGRKLPKETEANAKDPAAIEARKRLAPLVHGITKLSPAPLLTF